MDQLEMEVEVERIRNRDAPNSIHSIRPMNQEKTTLGEYNKCCSGGKVQLPQLGEHPEELRQLFTGEQQLSREFHGGKLMQQFIVNAYLKIEAERISYFIHNQDRLRADEYHGLVDYLHNRAEEQNIPFGKMVILPSTFQMSPRSQMQRYQDAMAVVSQIGGPSLFITMTCNPKWPEIVKNLPAGEEANNHPLLINRIFKIKLEELINAAFHITLRREDKLCDPFRIDQLIRAELPDPETERELYDLVGRHIIHGPCGEHNPTSVCTVDQKCTKKFPKYWYNNTIIRNGRVQYRRLRLNGGTIEIRRANRQHVLDSRFVVPYNPYLLLKYRTHINVEACTSTNTVKYLYKYFFKRPDQALLRVVETRNVPNQPAELQYDEIRSYLNGRYMTPPEAGWHILTMPMHLNSHHVTRLPIHLPDRQRVVFREGEEQAIVDRNSNTQLMAWFELNRINPNARQFLYPEIPLHFVWNKNNEKRWTPGER
ncbi:uncharacterized protein LOC123010140 [Tribolium madens]|uniref:uncharacterized protein LOC123010140 n=1 Tax=Tribolium madens TaxID=41895 RepID=UPI001CF722DF|nr:uncharacterized protein LOC123010140 [Tribolium madens]